MDYLQENLPNLITWLSTNGLRILVIIIIAFIAKKFIGIFVRRLVNRVVNTNNNYSKEALKKRKDTLNRIFSVSIGAIIWILTAFMILQELGVQIGPFLAAAGIAGLALGFGGQYLIRDLISGLFIIAENQYRIGDIVSFDGTSGTVQDITLRMTTLRDLDGVVHYIPHGEIKRVSNSARDFSRVNFDIGVSYSSDLEKVIAVIDKVGQELSEDPAWKEAIIDPPKFLRVNDFADSAVMLKILGDTKPLRQWEVAGEFRKRLKLAFDKEGIEIPFPQRVIHQSNN
ncbi:MAG: mechanosensitive ion channel family protein [Patescibacteria group bacterium]|nr:mechanosensitive ion channel family protein [Patescibacteria group bacterium]